MDSIFNLKFSNRANAPKYSTVTKLIKAVLALSHGSSDVERGFSRSKRILTGETTSMKVRTPNAKLFVVNGLKRYNNKPYKIPITTELINSAKVAHKRSQIFGN